jgi:hypothetical protein
MIGCPSVARYRVARALALVLLAAGCTLGTTTATVPTPVGAPIPEGWARAESEHVYDRETIYELVNGQADAYFAYNFEQVAVRTYEHGNGDSVEAEIWRVATADDAYGLFTRNRAGEPTEVGNGGDSDPGRRVAFWQDRYYVRIRARQDTPDDDLRGFATAISAGLPAGGARPVLVDRLPPDGLVTNGSVYFHLESSIQDELWLGGENVLGLNLDTDGVLAHYRVGGTVARLMVVKFSDVGEATAALKALRAAAIDGFVSASVEGRLLAAVFGIIPEEAAATLVAEALVDG